MKEFKVLYNTYTNISNLISYSGDLLYGYASLVTRCALTFFSLFKKKKKLKILWQPFPKG